MYFFMEGAAYENMLFLFVSSNLLFIISLNKPVEREEPWE